ncbi:hypothetical protein B0H14DRAFT_261837 [Mycena olivaceomarginata]|nr:hypothetical protein B0H14DRAFT_261837 [Mycena olivaceomarginata]
MSFNPSNTLGALEIGILTSYVLLGVTITQTYIYYSRFPQDPRKLKALVAFVCVCEIAHAICIGHTLYVWTISDYMHPESIFNFSPQSLITTVFFSSLIAACVQGFLPFRIYGLSKKLYISIIIWAMALMRLLGSTVLFVAGLRIPSSIQRLTAQWEWLIMVICAVGAATDVATTAALVTILVRQRSFAQKRTRALVDKLIVWAIETGLLTSASGIATLVCFALMPKNFIFLGMFVVLSRLYANTLLASLNSRETLRTMNEAGLPFSIAMMTETRRISYDGPEPTHGGADKI